MSWDDVAGAINRMADGPPDSDLYIKPAVKILAEKFVGEMRALRSRLDGTVQAADLLDSDQQRGFALDRVRHG